DSLDKGAEEEAAVVCIQADTISISWRAVADDTPVTRIGSSIVPVVDHAIRLAVGTAANVLELQVARPPFTGIGSFEDRLELGTVDSRIVRRCPEAVVGIAPDLAQLLTRIE